MNLTKNQGMKQSEKEQANTIKLHLIFIHVIRF